ncbi:MAG: FtsW/RodA/SpoVE family cell cycle protein [Paludibacteraceae bacterium]|nr:FtsW/RodA/SpoVE family cell cycle protein [Paludibacteraceae bacterium]
MTNERAHITFKGDKVLLGCIFLLVIVSMLAMFSAISSVAYKQSGSMWAPFITHCIYILFGAFIFFGVTFIPWSWIKIGTNILTAVSIAMLLILAVKPSGVNVEMVNGAARALKIGPIPIQPIEFAKLSVILLFASRLSLYQKGNEQLSIMDWCILGIPSLIIFGLVGIQNLSSTCIIFIVGMLMLYIGRVKMRYLLTIIGGLIFGLTLLVAVFELKPEWQPERYTTWKNRIVNAPVKSRFEKKEDNLKIEITDENRQKIYAQIAVANGRYPKGPGGSIERDFLPLAFSDYIYAIIIEEYGIYGAVFVMMLFFIIVFRGGLSIRKSQDPYMSLLAAGLASALVIQALINMMVGVSLGPVTGQPLPLISRGGNSIIFTFIYLALLFKISGTVQKHSTEQSK